MKAVANVIQERRLLEEVRLPETLPPRISANLFIRLITLSS
jgi:hypothetical protein